MDDHLELPSSERQVLKDGVEFSFQVVEADDQPANSHESLSMELSWA